ncbi:hypothetical protein C4Q31_14985 [Leptospira borgpetersenii serovar Ceylonica]|nr:hypothetical protein C4Q31_14985 [Leptospira borgpetersenii serovar Ceylonica]OOV44373.1 hypothetical protein B1H38_08970 [Leptospira borgpetersenii serovar Ballum]QHE27494.1 hypothetical protein GS524_11275 [Leptospira borgpetersenii]QHE30797.1 hypothetical protein GS523_11285 [Leptospira borgpetersenii]QHE34100.1 hypothetical protein GS517_11275 [Leptospira borgpetersenii]
MSRRNKCESVYYAAIRRFLSFLKMKSEYDILGSTSHLRKQKHLAPYHNLTHKYLDLNINLSELRQIHCKTYTCK